MLNRSNGDDEREGRGRPRASSRTAWGALLWCCAVGCAAVEVEPRPIQRPSGPLALADAVELALENNPDVRIARARVVQAAELVDDATSLFWPNVFVGGTFTRTDRSSQVFAQLLDQEEFSPTLDFNDPGTLSNFRTELGASVTLYDGGRRRARLAMAESELGSIAAQEAAVRSRIAFETARAWHRILEARLAAATDGRAVEVLERLVAFAQSEREAGATLATAVEELRVRLADARVAAGAAHDAVRRATTGLGVLLGLGVEEPFELAAAPPPAAGKLPPLDALLERARFERPELVRAALDIETALARVREAEAGYWPELRLFGAVGSDDSSARLGYSNWLFGAGLVESLTEAFRTPARVRRAAAEVLVAHEAGRRTLLAVEADVEAAWLDAADAERRLELARASRARDEAELERARAESDAGAARPATLLHAELARDRARARERIAELRRAMARIAADHAIGDYPNKSEDRA